VLEGSRHAFLALLTEQFKVDDARLLFGVELNPEDHSALHRRPSIAAVLHKHDDVINGAPNRQVQRDLYPKIAKTVLNNSCGICC